MGEAQQDIEALDEEGLNMEDELSQLQNRIAQLKKMKNQRQELT